jgi:hypothetical protein
MAHNISSISVIKNFFPLTVINVDVKWSQNGVQHSKPLGLWTSPIIQNYKCFGNWICLSSGEGRKTPTLLGPLERANLNCPVIELSSF